MGEEKWPWYVESDGFLVPIKSFLEYGALGCFLLAVVGFPLMFVQAIFVAIRALFRGTEALEKGEWEKALKHLGVILIPCLIVGGTVVFVFLLSLFSIYLER